MSDLVSVVVPVYNAEKTIDRCITSILNQSFKNLEIIAINDGSKDSSLEILNNKKNEDTRISIIDKENQGVSAARNDGIVASTGDYILFVDADDYLTSNAIEHMLLALKQNNCDSVVFGFEVDGDAKDDTEVLKKLSNSSSIHSSKEILEHVLTIDPDKEILGFTWRFLFNRQIAKENILSFDTSLKISEDYKFIVEYLLHSKNVCVLPEALYVYVMNSSSATSKYMPTLNHDMVEVNNWIIANIYPLVPMVKMEHSGCIANAYLNHVQNITKKDSEYSLIEAIKNAYRTKREYNYKKAIKEALKNVHSRKKAQIAFMMFNIGFDWLYMVLYYIKKRR